MQHSLDLRRKVLVDLCMICPAHPHDCGMIALLHVPWTCCCAFRFDSVTNARSVVSILLSFTCFVPGCPAHLCLRCGINHFQEGLNVEPPRLWKGKNIEKQRSSPPCGTCCVSEEIGNLILHLISQACFVSETFLRCIIRRMKSQESQVNPSEFYIIFPKWADEVVLRCLYCE